MLNKATVVLRHTLNYGQHPLIRRVYMIKQQPMQSSNDIPPLDLVWLRQHNIVKYEDYTVSAFGREEGNTENYSLSPSDFLHHLALPPNKK